MKFLLYAVMAYDSWTDAKEKSSGHVHWFNPYNITVVKAYEEDEKKQEDNHTASKNQQNIQS